MKGLQGPSSKGNQLHISHYQNSILCNHWKGIRPRKVYTLLKMIAATAIITYLLHVYMTGKNDATEKSGLKKKHCSFMRRQIVEKVLRLMMFANLVTISAQFNLESVPDRSNRSHCCFIHR